MAGRGPQSFKKRQKEQARKEKQEEKRARRLERKRNPHLYVGTADEAPETDTDGEAPENEAGTPGVDEGKAP
jgi:hypothetical protein